MYSTEFAIPFGQFIGEECGAAPFSLAEYEEECPDYGAPFDGEEPGTIPMPAPPSTWDWEPDWDSAECEEPAFQPDPSDAELLRIR